MKNFLAIVMLLSLPYLTAAQSQSLDKVFLLGTQEAQYEQLTRSYSQSLLEATGNDISKAYEQWVHMQQAIDDYAISQKYDINGVKVWLHVFWSPEGNIDKLGFLLRPDSRLTDTKELKVLLAGFIEQYDFPVRSSRPYQHYTGASFPTVAKRHH